MKNSYIKIEHEGGTGFQEVDRSGTVVRLTDKNGDPITPTEYSVENISPPQPTWAVDDMTPDPLTPSPTVEDVRMETMSRLGEAFGARDEGNLSIKVMDCSMRLAEIADMRSRGVIFSADDEKEASALRDLAQLYFQTKAVGNEFEKMAFDGKIKADFRADDAWNQ